MTGPFGEAEVSSRVLRENVFRQTENMSPVECSSAVTQSRCKGHRSGENAAIRETIWAKEGNRHSYNPRSLTVRTEAATMSRIFPLWPDSIEERHFRKPTGGSRFGVAEGFKDGELFIQNSLQDSNLARDAEIKEQTCWKAEPAVGAAHTA